MHGSHWPIVIVGGGAAGLMAAVAAGRSGVRALLLERNPKLGIKILMSGGGRCNVTNTGDVRHLVDSFPGNGRFLYSAFSRFSNDDVRALLAEAGVATKVEDRGRVFPVADTAREVVGALAQTARAAGATLETDRTVVDARCDGDGFAVELGDGTQCRSKRLILTTGGVSYPTSGTRGDGYRWAAAMGHTIVTPRPAIIALETREIWPAAVKGVALRRVWAIVYASGKRVARYREDVLFTHFGLSGPAVLNVSHQAVMAQESHPGEVEIGVRLEADTPVATWEQRLDERVATSPKRLVKNLFEGWWPASLAERMLGLLEIDPELQAGQLSRPLRQALAERLHELRFGFKRARPIEQAMVTAGGVDVREVDPKTMASKRQSGLYLAGEILDVDGVSGGYNLQGAFSTGWVAGEAAARSLCAAP